ncbi:MAG: 50S ribosomal protein L30 [Nitrospirota bacterium]|mgnify:CR=1 FL=1
MKYLSVTLVKSCIGRPKKHKLVALGMGLTKMNKTVLLKDTPEIRGMAHKICHLVSVVEVSRED